MAVLAAFVREHSRDADAHPVMGEAYAHTSGQSVRLREDLHGALRVIGRRDHRSAAQVYLCDADLRGADLRGAHLAGEDRWVEQPLDVPELAVAGGFTLRPWRLSDLPLVREASEDEHIPLITTVPSPYSEQAGIAFIERQWSRATTRAGYTFVIVASDGRPVGQVGLWLKDLDEGRASLGYWSSSRRVARVPPRLPSMQLVAWALRDLQIPPQTGAAQQTVGVEDERHGVLLRL